MAVWAHTFRHWVNKTKVSTYLGCSEWALSSKRRYLHFSIGSSLGYWVSDDISRLKVTPGIGQGGGRRRSRDYHRH